VGTGLVDEEATKQPLKAMQTALPNKSDFMGIEVFIIGLLAGITGL